MCFYISDENEESFTHLRKVHERAERISENTVKYMLIVRLLLLVLGIVRTSIHSWRKHGFIVAGELYLQFTLAYVFDFFQFFSTHLYLLLPSLAHANSPV